MLGKNDFSDHILEKLMNRQPPLRLMQPSLYNLAKISLPSSTSHSQMEHATVRLVSLQHNRITNISMAAVWLQTKNMKGHMDQLSTPTQIPSFISCRGPNLGESHATNWAWKKIMWMERCILFISQLISEDWSHHLISLQLEYNVSSTAIWQHIQICHLFTSQFGPEELVLSEALELAKFCRE